MNIIKTRKAYAAKIQKAEEDLKKLTREKEAFEAYASHVGGEPKATRAVKAPKTSKATRAVKAPKAAKPAKIRDKKPAKPQRKQTKAVKAIKAPTAKAVKGTGAPRLVDSIRDVLGAQTLNAKEVYEALKTKGLLPISNDPLAYIRAVLNRRNNFLPDKARGRGYYMNIAIKAKAAPKTRQPKAPKASFESYGVQDPTTTVGANPFTPLGSTPDNSHKRGPSLAPSLFFGCKRWMLFLWGFLLGWITFSSLCWLAAVLALHLGVGLALKTPSPERLYHVLL